MAGLDITVPSFVKGEPGFAAKLNELSAAFTQLVGAVNALAKELEAVKAPAPAKATTTRKAPTKAE